ncbi:MAG: hypothetical protein MPW14_03370 [Candidatus Manganitrophus sp.]|nr:MAG: hypothetical protein MPW14_03370 [Candidatus Manganitrophus sp.]
MTPPFSIEEEKEPSESLRLQYRYLDLRRKSVQTNFILRHNLSKAVRRFLDQHQFLDIETPLSHQEHARRGARLPRAQPRKRSASSSPCRSRRSSSSSC